MITPKPGEVYWAAEKRGRKRHRYIVVSQEEFNLGKYVTVVPTTSDHFTERAKLKNCTVLVAGAFGCFTENCVAQAEGIVTVEKTAVQLNHGKIGELSQAKMRELIRAIGTVIGANCEPEPKTA